MDFTRKVFVASLCYLGLTACGGGGGGGGGGAEVPATPTNSPPVANAASFEAELGVTLSAQLSANDADGDTFTFEITNLPDTGSLTLTDINTGQFSFDADNGDTTSFQFRVASANQNSDPVTVNINVNDDPLFGQQWHLNNIGQRAFALNGGTPGAGADLNLTATHKANIHGRGILIGVLDEGLEINHEDLTANIKDGASFNFINQSHNPTKIGSNGDHGTSVAGIAAATGWNNIGGRGVAPKAQLAGFNILASNQSAVFIAVNGGEVICPSCTGLDVSDVDIFNKSYGAEPPSQASNTLDDLVNAWKLGTENLRNGLGAIYLKAAGNEFENVPNPPGLCNNANIRGLSCVNANMDSDHNSPYQLVIASLNADGVKASYSNAGSSIFVSAPGGEFGSIEPAIITADQSGCNAGDAQLTSPSGSFNSNQAGNNENPNCNYTSTFNGTSSATPNVAGAVALLLEANPNLDWRDIKFILASSAVKVDPTQSGVVLSLNGEALQAELGWMTNAAGFNFHNWYGFGAVDVDAAVKMAQNYNNDLGRFVESPWINSDLNSGLTIPDNTAAGVSDSITVSDNLTIEQVQISISIDSVVLSGSITNLSDYAIQLTSPSGSKSFLMTFNNSYLQGDYVNTIFASNAFYGESSQGNWTITVIDGLGDGGTGTFTDWKFRIYGYNTL